MPADPLTAAGRDELVARLLPLLVAEQPGATFIDQLDLTNARQRRLAVQALLNVRPPEPLPPENSEPLDQLLAAEAAARSRLEVADLPGTEFDSRISLVRADITTLRCDAIVNAANSALLGCFAPLHACIDNAIHSAAGPALRQDCAEIMARRGRPEPTGTATITAGYHLPASYVVHTVGPIVTGGAPTASEAELLGSCYASCLALLGEKGLASVAFCSISTGVFGYPKPDAAQVAVQTVREHLDEYPTINKVVFDVFSETDESIYRKLLGADRIAG